MPAPVRELPQQLFKYSGLFPKGIQGHYNDAEIDTLLQSYATKEEVQQAVGSGSGLSPDQIAGAIEGQGIRPLSVQVGEGGVVYQDSYKLYVDNVGIGPRPVIEYSNQGQVTRLIGMTQEDAYTKTEVDAAITQAVSGGTVDLSNYPTKDELAAALSGTVTQHSSPLPQLSQGVTPLGIVAAWESYEPGVHRFESGAVAILAKSEIQDTNNGRPTLSKSVNVTVLLPGEGTTYVKAVTTAVDGVQSQADSTLVSQSGGQWFALTSSKGDEPFANPKMADLFAMQGGGGGTVYSQDSQPDSGNEGDLWLGPAPAPAAALNEALSSRDSMPALDEYVAGLVRKLMSGGKTVPDDLPWTECPKIAGSGLIEARVLNGVIQLRGDVFITYTSTGTFTAVRKLPAGFPMPSQEQISIVFGIEQNISYRRVFVRMMPSGSIEIVGDGKITGATLTGAQAYAY